MSGTLPALLVAAAFGIAVANAVAAVRSSAMIALVAAATLALFAPIPAGWNERVHLACWIVIVTCGASMHRSGAIDVRIAIALAAAAGTTGGVVANLANSQAAVMSMLLVATTTCIASRFAAQRVPLAPKVASSWLIAIALLAATLQWVPVTPGYLPDHLE
jgi:hypothetical protein